MPIAAQIAKLSRAGKTVKLPMKKAQALVVEVTVTAAPA